MITKESIEAYQKGARNRKEGVVVGDNPYDEDSPLFWEWMRGWLDGVPPVSKKSNQGEVKC